MSLISPVSDELIEGKREVADVFSKIQVPSARLKWDFAVVAKLLGIGENAKVFKFRADGEFCYVEAATSIFFRDCLGPCTDTFEYVAAFVDITPVLDSDKSVTLRFMSNTLIIETEKLSLQLSHTYGDLPDLQFENLKFKDMIQPQLYASALTRLNSATTFKNSFTSSATCYMSGKEAITTYPICWIRCRLPDNGIDQVVPLAVAPLLSLFLSHTKLRFSQESNYFILNYRTAYLALPRHPGSLVNFDEFIKDQTPVCRFRPEELVSILKPVLSFDKVPFVTLHISNTSLTLMTEASKCSVKRGFPVSSTTPGIEKSFSCQPDYLLTALSLFHGEEASLTECYIQRKRMMILTSTSLQLILSLRN